MITHPAKSLNLGNVFLKNIRLCPLVISIEFGNIVHLDIVPDAVSKAWKVRHVDQTSNVERDLHAMSRRSVSVILSSREIVSIVEFELFLQREPIKLSS